MIFLRYSGLGATGALLHSVSLGGEPLKPLNVRRAVVDADVEIIGEIIEIIGARP